MTRLGAAAIALGPILGSSACGGSSSHFTLAATERCLSTQTIVKGFAPTTLGETGVVGGAVHVTLRTGSRALLSFYRSTSDAGNVLSQVKAGAKSIHFPTQMPKSMFHTDGNVYVAWRHAPTAAEVHAVEGCLR